MLPWLWKLALGWLVVVNLWAFLAFWIDKRRALKDGRRLSESLLLELTVTGGAPGALLAMHLFRHKTRKQPFQSRFWGIVGLQAVAGFGALLAWIIFH